MFNIQQKRKDTVICSPKSKKLKTDEMWKMLILSSFSKWVDLHLVFDDKEQMTLNDIFYSFVVSFLCCPEESLVVFDNCRNELSDVLLQLFNSYNIKARTGYKLVCIVLNNIYFKL